MNRQVLNNGVYTLSDLEEESKKTLPQMVHEFYNGGAMDMITCRENVEAFNQYRIRPRILVDVGNIDMSVEVFGQKVAAPLGFSPTAFQRLAHPDGEIATSMAASKAGIPMCLSTYSTTSIEDVVTAGQGAIPYVMQLSVMKSREANLEIIRRAEKAGCKAVFVTVDCAVLGRRLNEARNNFTLPDHIELPHMPADCDWRNLVVEDDRLKYDASCTWKTLVDWARSHTKMQIWLKGVYTAEDVALAIEYGIDGVVVSNHGGRQLDSVTATLDALPEVVEAAAGRIPVHIDSGIRRGTDIFKALALGADHVWLGRAVIWGLAHDGEAGVSLAVNLLLDELRTTMVLAGCANIKQITRAHLARRGLDGRLHTL